MKWGGITCLTLHDDCINVNFMRINVIVSVESVFSPGHFQEAGYLEFAVVGG